MQIVDLGAGGKHEFPDDATPEEMQAAVDSLSPPPAPSPIGNEPGGTIAKSYYAGLGALAGHGERVAGAVAELADVGAPRSTFGQHEAAMLRSGERDIPESQALTEVRQAQEARRQSIVQPYAGLAAAAKEARESAETVEAATPGSTKVAGAVKLVSGFVPYIAEALVSPVLPMATGGLESYKSTFDAALAKYSKTFDEKTARRKAEIDAAQSGLAASEVFAALPGRTKSVIDSLVSERIKDASTLVKRAVELLATSVEGGAFMGSNSLVQAALAKQSYNPELPWKQALEEAAKDALAGAAGTALVHTGMAGVRAGVEKAKEIRDLRRPPETSPDVLPPEVAAWAASLRGAFPGTETRNVPVQESARVLPTQPFVEPSPGGLVTMPPQAEVTIPTGMAPRVDLTPPAPPVQPEVPNAINAGQIQEGQGVQLSRTTPREDLRANEPQVREGSSTRPDGGDSTQGVPPAPEAPPGATQAVAPAFDPAQYRPAIRMMPTEAHPEGELVVGAQGQTHNEIIQERKIPATQIDRRTFSDLSGQNEVDRATMAKLLETVGQPAEVKPATVAMPAEAHSTDLAKAQAQAPTPEQDFARYSELTASLKGKSLDEAQAIMQEVESIKNRYGGKPPPKPVQPESPKPAAPEPPAVEPKGEGKSELARRIAEASRRPDDKIVPVIQLKGTDGKWYGLGGFPVGVEFSGEKRIASYAYRTREGTTVGRGFKTEEEARQAQKENRDKAVEDFYSELLKMTPDQVQSQADYWLKEKPTLETSKLPERTLKPQKPLGTGDPETDAKLSQYRKMKRGKSPMTAAQEKALAMYEARAKSDPSKWKVGQGVGWRVDRQINRGFQVAEIDPQRKLARVIPVADTGLTVTGGGMEGVGEEWVHVADLVRDKKYDAQPSPPSPEPTKTETAAPTPEPLKPVGMGGATPKGLTADEASRLEALTTKVDSNQPLTDPQRKRYQALRDKATGAKPESEGGVQAGLSDSQKAMLEKVKAAKTPAKPPVDVGAAVDKAKASLPPGAPNVRIEENLGGAGHAPESPAVASVDLRTGEIILHRANLENSLLAFDSPERAQRWLDQVLSEEHIHSIGMRIAPESQYAELWRSLWAPQKAALIRSYTGRFMSQAESGYSDAQLGQELVRRQIQRGISGETTEMARAEGWGERAVQLFLDIAERTLAAFRKTLAASDDIGTMLASRLEAALRGKAPDAVSGEYIRSPEARPRDEKEYRKKVLMGDPAAKELTIGGYRHIAETQMRYAAVLGTNPRAQRLVRMDRNVEMMQRALNEVGPGGAKNYYEALSRSGSPGESRAINDAAWEGILRNQFNGIRLRREADSFLAELRSPGFQKLIERRDLSQIRAAASMDAQDSFRNSVAVQIAKLTAEYRQQKSFGERSDAMLEELQRLKQMPNLSAAVFQRMNRMVDTLSLDPTGEGLALLFNGGAKDGSDIGKLFAALRQQMGESAMDTHEQAFYQLAGGVLAASRDAGKAMASLSMLQKDPALEVELDAYGKALAKQIAENPAVGLVRLVKKAERLTTQQERAAAIFNAINAKVVRKVRQYTDRVEALQLHDAVNEDPQWREFQNDVQRNVGGKLLPDEIISRRVAPPGTEEEGWVKGFDNRWYRMTAAGDRINATPGQANNLEASFTLRSDDVFFEYNGRSRFFSPDGTEYRIDLGNTTRSVGEAQDSLSRLLGEIDDWLEDPANANSPSRVYWDEQGKLVAANLMTSAVVNPVAVRAATGTGGWGMPEKFYQTLRMPQAKLAFRASRNYDALYEQGLGWSTRDWPTIEKALRRAFRLQGQGDRTRKEYQQDILNNLGWEYRNGRKIVAGDIINGHTITQRDIDLLRTQGKSFNYLYDLVWRTGRILGAEDVIEMPRLIEEFTGGAWGIRRAMEMGSESNTTLPRKFSKHGADFADRIGAFSDARARALSEAEKLAPEAQDAARAKAEAEFYNSVQDLLDDPRLFKNVALAFMRQRTGEMYPELSPFEDLYRQITQMVQVGRDHPEDVAGIIDHINQNTDATWTPEKIRRQFLGEVVKMTEPFKRLYDEQSRADVEVVNLNRETNFNKAFTKDRGPAFFYDYGVVSLPEMRSFALDSAQFQLLRVIRAMKALESSMVGALSELKIRTDKLSIAERNRRQYEQGEDFANLQILEKRLKELRHFMQGIGAWSNTQTIRAEGFHLYRPVQQLLSTSIGAALGGIRTSARVSGISMGGSAVKMGNVLQQIGMGRFRAYPGSALSAIKSMARLGTGSLLGWYVPGKGIRPGIPARLAMNVPGVVRAMAEAEPGERIYDGIEAAFKGVTDDVWQVMNWWQDQKSTGMVPDKPIGTIIANMLASPWSKGGTLPPLADKYPETMFGKYWLGAKDWMWRLARIPDALIALNNTYFPQGMGYNVNYDSVGRKGAQWLDMLATHARRTFDTYERTGRLGQFDLDHPAKNVLAPWEVLPSLFGEKAPGWARPNGTNLAFAREMFSASTDVDLNDLIIRYWKRLSVTPPEQRGAIEFLAPEETDATAASERARARARGVTTRLIEQTHHAAPTNRPWWYRKAPFFQANFPTLGWTVQTLGQIDNYLGKVPFSPTESKAALVVAAGLTALGFAVWSMAGGDTEVRMLRSIDRFIHHKESTLKTIEEAKDFKEASEIAVHDLTAWIPVVNSAFNSITGQAGYRGGSGFASFYLDKINALLDYSRGVIRTGDPTYGLARLAESNIPITETIIEQFKGREGFQNNRNAVRVLQKFGPSDLVEKHASSSVPQPTELTPYKHAFTEALYSGDMTQAVAAYNAYVQKASELGRPDPNALAGQMLSSVNPYRQAFGSLLSDIQMQDLKSRLSDRDSAAVAKVEGYYQAFASMLGKTGALTKEESQPGPSGRGTALGGGGLGAAGFGGNLPRGTFSGSSGGLPRARIGSTARLGGSRVRLSRPRLSRGSGRPKRLVSGRLRPSQAKMPRVGRRRKQRARLYA